MEEIVQILLFFLAHGAEGLNDLNVSIREGFGMGIEVKAGAVDTVADGRHHGCRYIHNAALPGRDSVHGDGLSGHGGELIRQLEEQNTMLLECLLEMSEIVYA